MRPWLISVYNSTVWLWLNNQKKGLIFDDYFLTFALEVYNRVVYFYKWLLALPASTCSLFANRREELELVVLDFVWLKKVGRFGYFIYHVLRVIKTIWLWMYLKRSSSTLLSCWLSFRYELDNSLRTWKLR